MSFKRSITATAAILAAIAFGSVAGSPAPTMSITTQHQKAGVMPQTFARRQFNFKRSDGGKYSKKTRTQTKALRSGGIHKHFNKKKTWQKPQKKTRTRLTTNQPSANYLQ